MSDDREGRHELSYSDSDSDQDLEMEAVELAPPSATTAQEARQADKELHPALLLLQQQEAEEEQAKELDVLDGEIALDDAQSGETRPDGKKEIPAAEGRVVFKDGKGGYTGAIEIKLDRHENWKGKGIDKGRKRAVHHTPEQRATRMNAHKTHLIALLANSSHRNRFMNGDLLKARLLSLLPRKIVSNFTKITTQLQPNRAKRGRLFERTMTELVDWWVDEWEVDWQAGIRYRPFAEAETMGAILRAEREALEAEQSAEESSGKGKKSVDKKKKKKKKKKDELGRSVGGEIIRSSKSLQKKALLMAGSRDVSAQLFVGMCRALGIGTRLVASLQPVPWRMGQAGENAGGSSRRKSAGSTDPSEVDDDGENDDDEDDMEQIPLSDSSSSVRGIKSSMLAPKEGFVRWADRAPDQRFPGLTNKLGVTGQGNVLGGRIGSTVKPNALRILDKKKRGPSRKLKDRVQDPNAPFTLLSPPIFWAEVYSRPDQEWIPVDPVRGFLRKAKEYEPLPGTGEGSRNKMLYVVGFEEDGSVKDLTAKYSSTLSDKTLKQRVPVVRIGKTTEDWWGDLMERLGRGYKLQRDVVEDAKLEYNIKKKIGGMPATLSAFHNHPDYVLERHLKREEVVFPKIQHSLFRGEPVYKRSNVLQCKTVENWMRFGRAVKENEIPMKWVKTRAVTITRRREAEAFKEESGEEMRQPLYAESQTAIWTADPIVNGKIPRNGFGNIDLFAPTMLPPGAVHLPFKGIAKVAKDLDISFAEACTGFEFKNRKAIPKLEGVVVAVENEEALLDAYWIAAAEAERKEQERQKARALKRWERLISGMRIRQRLQQEYGSKAPEISLDGSPKDAPKKPKIKPYKAKPADPPKPIAIDFADQSPNSIAPAIAPSDTPVRRSPSTEKDDGSVPEFASDSDTDLSDQENTIDGPSVVFENPSSRKLQPKSLNDLLGATRSFNREEEDSDASGGDDEEHPGVKARQIVKPDPSPEPTKEVPRPRRIVLRTSSSSSAVPSPSSTSTTSIRPKPKLRTSSRGKPAGTMSRSAGNVDSTLKRTKLELDSSSEDDDNEYAGGVNAAEIVKVPKVRRGTRLNTSNGSHSASDPALVSVPESAPTSDAAGGRVLRSRGKKTAEMLALEKERERLEREAMEY
ncbi:Nucleotide excision repair complex XPC-HR23B, subunit XPC/DPB11 [Phaffia rhodozyma]|uniref:Nucleotide excision repair complex XPC-HR23B, subunit XPC/DPB11 n=1 Tax=Phaffia rhodozyma TaxID=264483 RepID=A0A0F7SJ85_PHARH|nr:Nucleotide excision repair complex XPC-HR23B, subunit XPC/DPB11 [Phaffia rhodozyma]